MPQIAANVNVSVHPAPAEKIAAAFNEWMRRYTENPESFEREFQSVGDFLRERAQGKAPSYGQLCAAYLAKLIAEMP